MIKTRIKSNRLSKNKIIKPIIFLTFFLAIIINIFTHESPIKRKLIGNWNIEFENSYIERDSFYQFLGIIINIRNKETIELPIVYDTLDIDFQGKTYLDNIFDDEKIVEKYKKHSEKMQNKAKGFWKIINKKPDSVFFNVPQNPLYGKYAVRFFIDEKGFNGMNNIYKMELKNDSTYLICNKGGFLFKRDVKDWERNN